MKGNKKVAIVGGGITGLVLANLLSPKHQIAIFEKESQLGGLSAGVKKNDWQWPLENFYHHFFTSDRETISLLRQLNIKYSFKRPKTATYQKNKIYQLDSASSLLAHPYLNLPQKLRAGAAIAALKLWPSAKFLEEKTAVETLPKIMGKKAYQALWEPLLWGKFGQEMNQVSAGWFWARIKKRSQKLGYPEGGFPTLVAKLERKIKKQGGKIFLNQEIKNLEKLQNNFGQIIITTSLPIFLKTTPHLPQSYQNKLKKIKHLGAINLILVCQKPLLPENVYWLNINEKSFPFVALVQHTHFINPRFYSHKHILYVGGYYPQNHPFFKKSKKELLKEFFPYLKKINPRFRTDDIKDLILTANLYAQPLVTPGYKELIPDHKMPLKNVYLACMEQIYPWDRGVNYAIALAQKVAKMIE